MDNKEKLPTFSLGDFVDKAAPEKGSVQELHEQQIQMQDPLLFANNPGSYEDLHKKTKGLFLFIYSI